MNSIKSQSKSSAATSNFRVFEEAREAVVKLRTLQPLLTPADEETLSLLMDKELMHDLEKSLKEAERGNVESLDHILK